MEASVSHEHIFSISITSTSAYFDNAVNPLNKFDSKIKADNDNTDKPRKQN